MHSYDVVGYAYEGYVLCPSCAINSENDSPIFTSSEWDSFPTCDVCNEPLEVSLTSDGIEYYRDIMGVYYDKRDCLQCGVEFYPQIGQGYKLDKDFCSEACMEMFWDERTKGE